MITRVCLLVGSFVHYARRNFSKRTTPIFMEFDTDVQRLLTFAVNF